MLAGRAHSSWSDKQQLELARNQFIHGIRSSTIQLQLMHDMPATLDAALSAVQKLETVEAAQMRLHQGKLATESLGVQDNTPDSESQANFVH